MSALRQLQERLSGAFGALGKRGRSHDPITDEEQQANKRPSFRPWDQKDYHRRLETYQPRTWFGKPEQVNNLACASRGWVNDGNDTLKCEFCNKKLQYPRSKTLTEQNIAANLFAQQLASSHASHCPWRNTKCENSVLAFEPSSILDKAYENLARAPPGSTSTIMVSPEVAEQLCKAYNKRLARLAHVDTLPDVDPVTLHRMARNADDDMDTDLPQPQRRSDSFRRLLALPAPHSTLPVHSTDDLPPAFDPSQPIVLPNKLTKAQKARLLALLGWEPEELPAGSPDRLRKSSSTYRPSRDAYSLAHLVAGPNPAAASSATQSHKRRRQSGALNGDAGGPDGGMMEDEDMAQGPWCSDNVVLNCHNCKSRVGLWSFTGKPPGLTSPGPSSATPIASPAPPSRTSQAQQDTTVAPMASRESLSGVAAAASSTPVVPLVSTIAGGSYDPTAAVTAPAATTDGPFGSRRSSAVPVYGLEALTLPPLTSRPSSGMVPSVFAVPVAPAVAASGPGTATAATSGPSAAAAAGPSAAPAATEQPSGVKRKHSSPDPIPMEVSTPGGQAVPAQAVKKARLSSGTPAPGDAKQMFDPLHYHRSWCPWVYTGSKGQGQSASTATTPLRAQSGPQPAATTPARTPTAAAAGAATPAGSSTPAAGASGGQFRCGWMHLLDSLDQTSSAGQQPPAAAGATPGAAPASSLGVAGSGMMDVDPAEGLTEVDTNRPTGTELQQLKKSVLSTVRNM